MDGMDTSERGYTSERGSFIAVGVVALIIVVAVLAWARPWASDTVPGGAPMSQQAAAQIETATASPAARAASPATTPAGTETPSPTTTEPPAVIAVEPAPTAVVASVEAPPPAPAPVAAAPEPVRAPAVAIAPAPAPAPAPAAGSFAGRWRIVDTVLEGANTGSTYTFDVVLAESGGRLEGGGDGLVLAGTVNGSSATVEFAQPALGFSGTFTWTLHGPDQATGTFNTNAPNAGTSTLVRV